MLVRGFVTPKTTWTASAAMVPKRAAIVTDSAKCRPARPDPHPAEVVSLLPQAVFVVPVAPPSRVCPLYGVNLSRVCRSILR
jgi:hypothetical protein